MAREKEKKLGREQRLLDAARLGQVDQLEALLSQFMQLKPKRGTNPLASLSKCAVSPNDIRDPVTGFTCLHHAALNGHARCVQLILAWPGARPTAVDYKGSSALHLAAWAGNLQIVQLLLDHSAGARHQSSAAAAAAGNSNDRLNEAPPPTGDIDLNLRNNDNQTALSLAAQFGHHEVVGELLRRGANVHLRNNRLESALELACLHGRAETARLLLGAAPRLLDELRGPHSTVSISLSPPPPQAASQPLDDVAAGAPALRRQIVSGWSSLLRGGGGAAKSTSQHQSGGGKSPRELHSAHPLQLQQKRRASLAAGQFVEQAQQQQQQRLLYAQNPLNQLSLDSTAAAPAERLLDHAPLHLAVRRGHANVVHLLLAQFNANLMQLTGLGSVLHEIAMACAAPAHELNGRSLASAHSDILNLFVTHLIHQTGGNFVETKRLWNQLLSMRNSQGKTVFDLLLECEQQQRPALMAHNNSNNAAAAAGREIRLFLSDMSRQLDKLASRSPAGGAADCNQSVAGGGERRLFATSQQMNSFVTMKRAPKQQQQQHNKLAVDRHVPANAGEQHNLAAFPQRAHFNQTQRAPLAEGTQTIDRRLLRQMPARHQQQQQQQHLFMMGQPPSYEQHSFAAAGLNQPAQGSCWPPPVVARPGQQPHQFSHQPAHLTRSVSNLIDQQQQQTHSASPGPHWAQQAAHNLEMFPSQQQQQPLDLYSQQQEAGSLEARKARSKSRDLGSLLMEVEQARAAAAAAAGGTGQQSREQLYDNQPQLEGRRPAARHGGQLVRSQTDCSHLMGRLFGPAAGAQASLLSQQPQQPQLPNQFVNASQQRSENSSLASVRTAGCASLTPTQLAQQHHSATLDRRAINRHYHVYEHEFYPPRLVSSGQQRAAAGKPFPAGAEEARHGKQAVAIVPPLRLDQQQQCRAREPAHQDGDARQQEQMDRFVCRLSRKAPSNGSDEHEELTIDTSEQQRQQRTNGMHGSQSLESQLGQRSSSSSEQSHLFESTRQALMRDFDQMLGRELLARRDMAPSSSSHSILTGISLDMDTRGERLTVSGTRITMMPAGSASSQQLSADCAAAAAAAAARASSATETANETPTGTGVQQSLSSDSLRRRRRNESPCERRLESGRPRDAGEKRARPPRPARPPARQAGHSVEAAAVESSQTVAGSSGDSGCSSNVSMARVAPQKPPRPSLRSQQVYKSLQLSADGGPQPRQQGEPVIYDLPTPSARRAEQHQACPGSRASATSSSASNSLISTPLMQAAAPPPSASKQAHWQQAHAASLTEPPRERPPPPPTSASGALLSPLSVITQNARGAAADQDDQAPPTSSSCRSTCSQVSSGTATSDERATAKQAHEASSLLLLKRTGASQSTSSNSPSSSFTASFSRSFGASAAAAALRQPAGAQHAQVLAAGHQQQQQQQSALLNDADSGVCTSNSPASLSHDSDELPGGQPGAPHELVAAPQLQQQANSRCLSERPSSRATSCGSTIVSPPSPRTAQLSIEEALVPLEDNVANTQETANQTGRAGQRYRMANTMRMSEAVSETGLASLSAQVEMIFGWLGATERAASDAEAGRKKAPPASRASGGGQQRRSEYENCAALQQRLQAARCRSIGNLFSDLAPARRIVDGVKRAPASKRVASAGDITTSSSASMRTTSSPEDDDDYACTLSPDLDESRSSGSPRLSPCDTSSCRRRRRGPDERAPSARKEVTLKVVVDEGARSTSGDLEDVFYIDPVELNKIANLNSGNKMDAATLTDEELCASVDKDSGYIRFTLKKRRGLAAAAGREQAPDECCGSQTSATRSCDEKRQVLVVDRETLSIEDDDRRLLSVKRTKKTPTPTEAAGDGVEVEGIQKSERKPASQDECEQPSAKLKDAEAAPEAEKASAAAAAACDMSGKENATAREAQATSTPTQRARDTAGARKASADSIQMDTSQASSTASSEMSIKSIVSCKNQERDVSMATSDDAMKSPAGGVKSLTSPARAFREYELDLKPIGRDQERRSTAHNDDDDRQQQQQREGGGETTPRNSPPPPLQLESVAPAPRAVKSIVSETARRLEAAAAAASSRNSNSMKRPIAAARRNAPAPAARPTSMGAQSGEPAKAAAAAAAAAEDKENVLVQPLAPPPAKRSICWPPKQASSGLNATTGGPVEGQTGAASAPSATPSTRSPGPAIGRVTANRLSFQRLIEESNSSKSGQSGPQAAGRPKPPPPVKPAGLIANRFRTQT